MSNSSSDESENFQGNAPMDMVTLDPEDTFPKDDRNKRKAALIQGYCSGSVTNFNSTTMKSINREVRRIAIPAIKFLSTSKTFGSFDQPDFSDPKCWVNKVFNNLSGIKNASDKKKAAIWTTYKNKVREQFSLHRSGVTIKIKTTMVKGKLNRWYAMKTDHSLTQVYRLSIQYFIKQS